MTLLLPSTTMEFWTLAMAVGTVGLLVVAGFGLRSLRLMKTDMTTRALRDSRVCALERCEELSRDLIPENGALLQEFSKLNLPVFVQDPSEVSFDSTPSRTEIQRAEQWVRKLAGPLQVKSIRFLNDLEAWSAYFVNRVADHGIAFGPCAPVVCRMVVQYYALLITLREKPSSGNYPNLTTLFHSWNEGLEREQRGLTEGNLLRMLEELQSRKPSQYPLDPPIGTVLDE